MIERLVRYTLLTDYGEQIPLRHRWTVLIINEPREIRRIKKRFLEQLAPADDLVVNYDSLIEKSRGLHCEIFSFSSEKGKIENPSKIYLSKNIKHDRNLFERPEQDYENYLRRFLS